MFCLIVLNTLEAREWWTAVTRYWTCRGCWCEGGSRGQRDLCHELKVRSLWFVSAVLTKCVEKCPLKPVWRPTVTILVTLHRHGVTNHSENDNVPYFYSRHHLITVISQWTPGNWATGDQHRQQAPARSLPLTALSELVSPLVSIFQNNSGGIKDKQWASSV